jgi:radical SAM superfamily enzyme YgiQ (UPF0313 family)
VFQNPEIKPLSPFAPKKRCWELFDEKERNKLKFLWISQVKDDLAADEHFVKRMAEAGCRRVFIGYESLNEQNLREMKKNESFETIEHSIGVFHRYGIAIHGMFIYGANHDTVESFRNTVDFCTPHHIESAQFIILTPIPGTELWKKPSTRSCPEIGIYMTVFMLFSLL